MLFRQLLEPETCTYTYLIADETTKEAVLVDPVIEMVDRDLQLIHELGLNLKYCLETHIHADHITGTGKLREKTGCLGIVPSQANVACADRELKDGESLTVGAIKIEAIATPGHTNIDLSYYVNSDRILTGDALFIRGCGRTDFQSGNPGRLYDAITERLLTLPDSTLVYPGHDYRGQTVSTIGEEKQFNPRLNTNNGTGQKRLRSRQEFIDLMNHLDLPNPKKIMEALPANAQCGNLSA